MYYRLLCLALLLLVFARIAVAQNEPKSDQEEMRKYAETLFRSLQFSTDSFVLSPEVKKVGFIVELRGAEIKRCKDLYDKQNWLQLLNTHLPSFKAPFTEFPNRSEVKLVCDIAGRQKCQVFVSTAKIKPLAAIEKNELVLIAITGPTDDADDVADPLRRYYRCDMNVSVANERFGSVLPWREHPDGTGLLVDWSPGAGRTFVAYGSRGKYSNPLDAIANAVEAEKRRLNDKRQLGELTDRQHHEAIVKLADETILKVTRLVTGKK